MSPDTLDRLVIDLQLEYQMDGRTDGQRVRQTDRQTCRWLIFVSRHLGSSGRRSTARRSHSSCWTEPMTSSIMLSTSSSRSSELRSSDWKQFTSINCHSFISGMHHHGCVAPTIDIILQRGQFWVTSTVSFRDKCNDSRSCCVVFIHVVGGFPVVSSSSPRGSC